MTRQCEDCGQVLQPEKGSCPVCGGGAPRRSPRPPEREPRRAGRTRKAEPSSLRPGPLLLALAVGLVLGLLAAGPARRESPPPATPADPAVQEVLSGLPCPCGNCEDLVADCSCDHPGGAREIKAFVAQALAGGQDRARAREQVLERYFQGTPGPVRPSGLPSRLLDDRPR